MMMAQNGAGPSTSAKSDEYGASHSERKAAQDSHRAMPPESVAAGFHEDDVIWAKLPPFCWWPAQIKSQELAEGELGRSRPANASMGAVLVQFFGTFDFAWISASKFISSLETDFQARSTKTKKQSFTRAVDQAMEFRTTSRLPEPMRPETLLAQQEDERRKDEARKQAFGVAAAGTASKGRNPSPKDTQATPAATPASRKRKPPAQTNAGDATKRQRQAKVSRAGKDVAQVRDARPASRKVRIMRLLGLAPPLGSPYRLPVP
eukprot:jgi/Chlat1/4585/Chrsp290S04340